MEGAVRLKCTDAPLVARPADEGHWEGDRQTRETACRWCAASQRALSSAGAAVRRRRGAAGGGWADGGPEGAQGERYTAASAFNAGGRCRSRSDGAGVQLEGGEERWKAASPGEEALIMIQQAGNRQATEAAWRMEGK